MCVCVCVCVKGSFRRKNRGFRKEPSAVHRKIRYKSGAAEEEELCEPCPGARRRAVKGGFRRDMTGYPWVVCSLRGLEGNLRLAKRKKFQL